MRVLLILFVVVLVTKQGVSQGLHFKIRSGLTGTGTFDKGLWFFKDTYGLGPQEFIFQNSWGLGIDLEYQLKERLMIGIHMAFSRTGFQLAIDDNNIIKITDDPTTHNQFIAEAKYFGRPGKVFRPFIGMNAGILYTRDIQLTIRSEDINFELINPFIYGFVLGFDHAIGSNGLSIHFIIRGQTFEYTTKETSITKRQTLLDQVWWMNFNHLQLGIGKRF